MTSSPHWIYAVLCFADILLQCFDFMQFYPGYLLFCSSQNMFEVVNDVFIMHLSLIVINFCLMDIKQNHLLLCVFVIEFDQRTL